MKSAYFMEGKKYSWETLKSMLSCSNMEMEQLINILRENNIVKKINNLDRQNDKLFKEYRREVDVNQFDYVFNFVGIVIAQGIVFKCYPKYIVNSNEPKMELCQILKVLKKCEYKYQQLKMFDNVDKTKYSNHLAIILRLFQDYFDNGLYYNFETNVEINGEGEIIWDKTMDDSFVLFSNKKPIYTELYTKCQFINENDYFKRLHECVLTLANKELKKTELLEYFEIPEIELSNEMLDEFGDKEYILYKLEKELKNQYVTRKQNTLSMIYAFVNNEERLFDIDCFTVFGTNHFNVVWEMVCSEIMNNQLHKQLYKIKCPIDISQKYNITDTLQDIIEKPFWSYANRKADDTFIPDLITTFVDEGSYYFAILDAKYYTPLLEKDKSPKGQPGIESIIKQYMYQLSFQHFINDSKFDYVLNCFLMPSDERSEIITKGYVELENLQSIGLQKIQVKFLPAVLMYDYYLKGRSIELPKLFNASEENKEC